MTPQAYLPLGMKAESNPRVVHVHASSATFWDFQTGWYGDYVNQDVVYGMMDQGLMRLTGTSTRAAAWEALIPQYVLGQRVAIKVNLNCARSVNDSDNSIDALIEVVNGIVRGLKAIGVAEADIWVYDAVRSIPDRFRNGCRFPGVQFSGIDVNSQGFSDLETATFELPQDASPIGHQRISNVLVNADYLVNVPIMKKHGGAGVTLSFKNHFGSVDDCRALHPYVGLSSSEYRSDYNPMVDLLRNQHFAPSTVLTVGDGIYGSRGNQCSVPEPWVTFGNQAPNSLFFSQDPVAMDCVMYDMLEAEAEVEPGADDYLRLAAHEGLGVFEHRAHDASDSTRWYSLIDYVYLESV
jgi:uncharacterized protein (DUF362 family)